MDIKLNLSYHASIMLDAFKDLLCSKLCWHNRPGPSLESIIIYHKVQGHAYNYEASHEYSWVKCSSINHPHPIKVAAVY